MVNKQSFFFDEQSPDEMQKRMTVLPQRLTEENKAVFIQHFKSKLQELEWKDANEILVRSSPKDIAMLRAKMVEAYNVQGGKNTATEEQGVVKYCEYPLHSTGNVTITNEDYKCLEADHFLNDVIIDFYLKYIQMDLFGTVEQCSRRTHIFSTYFYERLTTRPPKSKTRVHPIEDNHNLSLAEKRYERVKKWTKKVNIFNKDFIVVPINEDAHWFVCVICFPGQEGSKRTLDNENEVEERSPGKVGKVSEPPPSLQRPCILIFDSLKGGSKARTFQTLRDYLTCEWRSKMVPNGWKERKFDKALMPSSQPEVQQQQNLSDCGIFLLLYIQSFFHDPISDYNFPIRRLCQWFTKEEVEGKRKNIAEVIRKLTREQNPKKERTFPELNFLNREFDVSKPRPDKKKPHDIKTILPPPPKKFKATVKDEGSKKVTKGEKVKEVCKGEVKGEKSKKDPSPRQFRMKSVLEPDLSWHESNRHQKEKMMKEEKTGFHCTICVAKFSDLHEFRLHQAEGHSKKCHVSECNAKFGTKIELQRHVVTEHGVVHSMEMGEDVVAHLTTTRSQENIDFANRAKDWISNPMAVKHMERVMKGICKSRRHTLFMDRRERLRCSGSDTSRLYQLSNPGFIGGGGEVDTAVIKQLEKVFLEHLPKAQKELQEVCAANSKMVFVYVSCVLFPETFIHQHQLQGKNREQAEVAFMEVEVGAEERKVLN